MQKLGLFLRGGGEGEAEVDHRSHFSVGQRQLFILHRNGLEKIVSGQVRPGLRQVDEPKG